MIPEAGSGRPRSPPANSTMPMLSVRGLSKSFGGVRALEGVSLHVDRGEVLALVGENGAGKSTLIRILSGAHPADAGTLTLEGRELPHLSPERARALGIAVIYQQPALLPDLSVAENVALGHEPAGLFRRVDWPARRRRATELLARLGLALDPDRAARTLSMPEKQLCEIARALGADARVLVLDEPTASLSMTDVRTLLALLRDLRAQGLAIVYVSHRLEEVFAIADRVSVLRDGVVVATRAAQDLDRASLIRLMVGRELAAEAPRRAGNPGALALEVRAPRQPRCRGARRVPGHPRGRGGRLVRPRQQRAHRARARALRASRRRTRARSASAVRPWPSARPGTRLRSASRTSRRTGGSTAWSPAMSVAANCTLSVLPQIRRRGLLDRGREYALARGYVERLQVKTASLERGGGDAVRREPAEGRPRPLARDESEGPDPRRAHPGSRRRCQGGDPRARRRARGAGPRGARDLVRAAGAPRAQRPHRGHARRHDRRRCWSARTPRPSGCWHCALGHARGGPCGLRRTPGSARWRVALAALLLLLAVAAPGFFRAQNLRDLLLDNATVLIAAVGMTLRDPRAADRHLDRLAVRDLRASRRARSQAGAADAGRGAGPCSRWAPRWAH